MKLRLALLAVVLILAQSACLRAASDVKADRWMNAYMNGHRTGYIHTTVRRASVAGKPGYRVEETIHMAMTTGTVTVTSDVSDTICATANLMPVRESYRAVTKSPLGVFSDARVEAQFGERKIDCRVVEDARETRKTVAIPAGCPLMVEALYPLRSVELKPGGAMRFVSFDAGSASLQTIARKIVRREKVTTEAGTFSSLLATEGSGASQTAVWLLPSGETLKMTDADITLVRTTREKALTPIDTSRSATQAGPTGRSAAMFQCDRALASPHEVSSLRVDLVGVPSAEIIVKKPGQSVTFDAVTHTAQCSLVSLEFDREKGARLPIDAKGFEAWLGQENESAAGRTALQEKAMETVGEESNAYLAVCALRTWVFRNLRPSFTAETALSAEAVLKSMTGDCKHASILLVGLARSAGIPARVVQGIVLGSDGGFRGHAWVECYVGEWVPFDATRPYDRCDATHIELTSQGVAALVSSQLPRSAKVLDVEYFGPGAKASR